MKIIKLYDAWIQAGLILVLTILSIIKNDGTFFIAYCIVGVWQLVSIFIHVLNGWFKGANYYRYYYNWVLVIMAIAFLIGLIIPVVIMIFLYLLIWSAPFMAIVYCIICFRELSVLNKRPLAILK